MPETVWSQRGSVAADGHAALIARLSSLCDGSPANTEQLHYHDKVYTAAKATRTQGSVSLRAREHLDSGESELVYLGPLAMPATTARSSIPAGGGRGGGGAGPNKRVAKTTTAQARILVETGPSLSSFVEAVGLQFEREVLRKGVLLKYNAIITVTVTQLYRLAKPGDVATAVLLNGYYLVEASGAEGGEEKVVASLDRLMAQLKPLVHMQPWG